MCTPEHNLIIDEVTGSEICTECSRVSNQPIYGDKNTHATSALTGPIYHSEQYVSEALSQDDIKNVRQCLLEVTARHHICDSLAKAALKYMRDNYEKLSKWEKKQDVITAFSLYYALIRQDIIIYDMDEIGNWFNVTGKSIWNLSSRMEKHFCFSHQEYIEPLCIHLLQMSFHQIKEIQEFFMTKCDTPWWTQQSFSPKNMAIAIIMIYFSKYSKACQDDIETRLGSSTAVRKIMAKFKAAHPHFYPACKE